MPGRTLDLRLFVPLALLHNRPAVLHICGKEGLNILSHARHNIESDHLRLTVVRPDHMIAIRSSRMSVVAGLIESRTGWRRVGWDQHPRPRVYNALPNAVPTSNRFSPLAGLPCGRFGRPHRPRARLRGRVTMGSLNVNGLAHRPDKLLAVVDLMTERDIHVLTVQETHVTDGCRVRAAPRRLCLSR